MAKRLWHTSRPLCAAGILMLAMFVLSLAAMAVDGRTIAGAPAWLKPAKFAISTAIYSLTLAWILGFVPMPLVRATAGWVTAVVFVVEVAIIDLQAWRGTTSHFNVATPLDAALFGIMGFAIAMVWLVSLAVTVALFLVKIDDRGMAWALRLGMVISLFGAGTGGIMVRPTEAQRAEAASAGGRLRVSGAHTVGAPDGGPGMPFTKWSREHGDLRVPHFAGLHAMQVLPLFAWLLGRRRQGMVIAAALAYAVVFVVLLVQALEGRPFPGGML